jgi:hypothetical protein
LNKVGHQYLTSKIFFAIIFATKCFLATLSCSSFRTIYVFEMLKHLRIMLSCPIIYINLSFKGKGSTFLANFCFWTRFRIYGIWLISK